MSRTLALKIDQGAGGISWRTHLTLAECLQMIAGKMLECERSGSDAYWTAAIYENAMCLCLYRYFPPRMRVKRRRSTENFSGGEDPAA